MARAAAMQKTREATKKEAAKQNAVAYDQILAQIRNVNDRIPDKMMTDKINEKPKQEVQRTYPPGMNRALRRHPEKLLKAQSTVISRDGSGSTVRRQSLTGPWQRNRRSTPMRKTSRSKSGQK